VKFNLEKIFKNIARVVSVNIIRLMVSVMLTLLLPKFLDISEYSHWQLYMFYLMYAVYTSLGWCEGLYLKYGGKTYNNLNFRDVGSQFWALALYEFIFSLLAITAINIFINNTDKKLIIILVLISALFEILRYSLQIILQATNEIKAYVKIAALERVLFFIFVAICLGMGIKDYRFYIVAEIIARIISLVYAMILCKKVVFIKLLKVKDILKETKVLINDGYKLLVAYLTSQLVIGIVRFCIELKWGTIVFGKVSLALSLSNMIITTIAAISIVLFPILKKLDTKVLKAFYFPTRTLITYFLLFILIFYSQIYFMLAKWLPQYIDSLKYLAVIFPICVFEGRSFILTDTYFKAYKRPDLMFLASIITVILSLIFSFISVYILNSVEIAIISIVVLVAFKNIIAEYLLKRYNGKFLIKNIIIELGMTIIFMVSSWTIGGLKASLIYLIAFIVYSILIRKELITTIAYMKKLTAK